MKRDSCHQMNSYSDDRNDNDGCVLDLVGLTVVDLGLELTVDIYNGPAARARSVIVSSWIFMKWKRVYLDDEMKLWLDNERGR